MDIIRFGSRGSLLALTQTNQVIELFKQHHPDWEVCLEIIKTTGDSRQDVGFSEVGTKGMFVKEIEEALISGRIDVGVHSAKDLPGDIPDGLAITTFLEREDPRDALISNGLTLTQLQVNAVVGTSSQRRRVQLEAFYPTLTIKELRGNLDTRIRKLQDGEYDAIILACAGLNRLGWNTKISERLSVEQFIPAPGQGALALETRLLDNKTAELLSVLHHAETGRCLLAERTVQSRLNAGCTIPAGAYCTVQNGLFLMRAMIAESDGSNYRSVIEKGDLSDPIALGNRVAKMLLA